MEDWYMSDVPISRVTLLPTVLSSWPPVRTQNQPCGRIGPKPPWLHLLRLKAHASRRQRTCPVALLEVAEHLGSPLAVWQRWRRMGSFHIRPLLRWCSSGSIRAHDPAAGALHSCAAHILSLCALSLIYSLGCFSDLAKNWICSVGTYHENSRKLYHQYIVKYYGARTWHAWKNTRLIVRTIY